MKTKIFTKSAAIFLSAAVIVSSLVFAGSATASATETELPARYDSRDYGYITPVRNQKGYGTCWAHGTIAACEASLVKNNGFSNDLDLSEYHLSYSATHKMYDKLGLFDSEFDYDYSQQYMSDGGLVEVAANTLACWNGAVLDTAHNSQFSSTKFDYEGLNQLDFESKELQYCMNAVCLNDYVSVKTKDVDTIKENIMKYGAGACSSDIYSEGMDNETGVWLVTPEMSNFTGSHAVCVVGWDDTIPASELSANGYSPQGDGAFIIKNSWGEESGDNGYYYIPYTDNGLSGNFYFFGFSTTDDYTHSYGYDDLHSNGLYNDNDSTESAAAANVYTSVADETLKAVSFFTTGFESGFEVSVYTDLPENSSDPESGTLRAQLTSDALKKGFHTLTLDQPISLSKGDKFAVVLRSFSNSDISACICINYPSYDEQENLNATPKRGESYFYSVKDGWKDAVDAGKLNPRIKALTYCENSPSATEPDDYNSCGGYTKAELINDFNALYARFLDIEDKLYNFDTLDTTNLENYAQIAKTLSGNPDVFNASEIFATAKHFKEKLENLKYLNPNSMLEYFEQEGDNAVYANPTVYPLQATVYLEFMELYAQISKMAENEELTMESYYDMKYQLGEKILALMYYVYRYGDAENLQNYGDVNNDGTIDINDVTELQKLIAGINKFDFYSHANGDANGDYNWTIQDATDIQKYLAQLTDYLPAYGRNFNIEDDYTPDTDKATLVEYLRTTAEPRAEYSEFSPSIYEDTLRLTYRAYYDAAKAVLDDAENQPDYLILYHARLLRAFVPEPKTYD